MGVRLDESDLRSILVLSVNDGDPAEQAKHQDRLIRHLYDTETLEVWGRSLAKHYGRPNDHEEITQVVTEELIRYVRTITPDLLSQIDRVATHLYFKAKTAVVRWLDSPAVTVAGQMSGISRRYRQSMVAKGEFIAKFGREPSDRELVEYINTRVEATRKDAAKQGALVSEADVSGRMLSAYSMDHQIGDGEYAADSFGTPTQDDTVRGRGELAMTVQLMGTIADRMFGEVSGPSVREVLAVWMDFVLDNEPPTVTAIAAALSINRQQARERMRQVEAVLAAVRDNGAAAA